MPPVLSGFVLPPAASVFRVGASVAQPVGALFLARLYGVALVVMPVAQPPAFGAVLARFLDHRV